MNAFRQLLFRLRHTFARRHQEEEMAEELRHHLELRAERNIARGMSADDAREAAHRAFGGIEQVKERARDQHRARWLENVGRDVTHGMRTLRRYPLYAFTVVATLALCLTATLTIYSVVDAVLIRPLPFSDADRLVTVFNSYPGAGYPRGGASLPNYFERRHALPALASVAMITAGDTVVGEPGRPERVRIGRITPEFFSALRVPLVAGRTFTEAEFDYGAAQVAILTDDFWRSHFAADPDVIGKTFLNDDVPTTVIGLLPPKFRYVGIEAQFFRPFAHDPGQRHPKHRHENSGQMIARLAPGATVEQAQAQLDGFNAREMNDSADPTSGSLKGWGYHSVVRPLQADFVEAVKPTLLVLLSGALFMLLIGVGNVANVMLVRALARAREIAVRQALGASHFDIARTFFAETAFLTAVGAAIGIAASAVTIRLVGHLGADQLPVGSVIEFNPRMAVCGALIGLAVTAVLSTLVLLFTVRRHASNVLIGDLRTGTSTRAAQRLRHGFIVGQIGLAFVLLTGAALLGVSLRRVLEAPKGFNPDQVLTGKIALPWKRYPTKANGVSGAERLLATVQALPGVTHAALNNSMPFTGMVSGIPVTIEPSSATAVSEPMRAHHRSGVTPDYWATMNIRLQQGRLLEPDDAERSPTVCVVDEALARRYWPDQNAIGRRLCFGTTFNPNDALTIVGVVASVKQNDLGEADNFGMLYLPFRKFSTSFFYLVVRSSVPPSQLVPMLRKAILQLDPELPLDDVQPLQLRIDRSMATRVSPTLIAALYAATALLLAGVGLYGILAFGVAQRTREFGVRIALGAAPRDVLRLVLRQGAWMVAAGLGVGTLAALAATRYLRSLLFEVSTNDPQTFVTVALGVAAVALIASLIPARRATRVDPNIALRVE